MRGVPPLSNLWLVVFSLRCSPFDRPLQTIELGLAATQVLLSLLQKVEYVLGHRRIRRLIPADFEILFPVPGPRPAVVVDISRVGAGKLSRSAIGITEIAQTLDVSVSPGRIVRGRLANKTIGGMQRLDERFGVIKYRLVIESHELAARVVRGLVGFDRLELVAVFEHGVRQSPALHIRGPG